MKTFNNMKMATKINVLVLTILFIFAIVIGIVVQHLVADGVKDSAVEKARSDMYLSFKAIDQRYPGEWEIKDGSLYKGETQVNDNFEMVDYIAEMTGGTVTIFQDDTRVTTNVLVDGQRAIGTQASDMIIEHVLQNGHNYFGEANVAGVMSQTAYQPIKDASGTTIGMWFVGVSQHFIDETISKILTGLIVVLVIGVAIAVVVVLLFANQIRKRLANVGQALAMAGNGDFTTNVNDRSKDEIGQLAQNYQSMKENLSLLIKEVIETSEQVAASSEQLSAGAEETSRATDQISESIQSVASGSENQVMTTGQANSAASGISGNMKQITSHVKTVTDSAQLTKEKAEEGAKVIHQSIVQMELIQQKTEEISKVVEQLGNKSNEIGNIVTLITAVAEQTNLLALNAAIEAARAGEHGKGFAVVADEVRKLAEQSSHSAGQIRVLIQDIQTEIKQSVLSMDEAKHAVGEGEQSVQRAGTEFEGISESVQQVTSQIQEVSTAVNQITKQMASMVSFIDEATNLAEESSSYTQEVAAAAEEQNATMEEVASAATTLSEMAEGLQESVKKFKV
ncbi:methyl-accepting chemotaxis protein [Alkalihalobacillus sp. MEB130]|uniref:methyl-accepting chemotaxis protein n=1 Tax=Alkalihalobacillus sp. MEB130 TaxID=2976704 RepID=UPI0028DDDC64|nr:methyl-accepting chemotaxis protein [Alkalihalobacillus sp. MEB130]MDT8858781.1 methyl-accepting chemotaxis protein [Alkalihalobacillus sp. MEB130]